MLLVVGVFLIISSLKDRFDPNGLCYGMIFVFLSILILNPWGIVDVIAEFMAKPITLFW